MARQLERAGRQQEERQQEERQDSRRSGDLTGRLSWASLTAAEDAEADAILGPRVVTWAVGAQVVLQRGGSASAAVTVMGGGQARRAGDRRGRALLTHSLVVTALHTRQQWHAAKICTKMLKKQP